MPSFNITDFEKDLVYQSLVFKRQDLQKQIDHINSLISKYKNENQPAASVSNTRSSRTDNHTAERILEVLTETDTFLTSRQILEAMKVKFDDLSNLSKDEDRKYMAIVSATLTTKIKQNKVDKIKDDGKDPVYFIKKGS